MLAPRNFKPTNGFLGDIRVLATNVLLNVGISKVIKDEALY